SDVNFPSRLRSASLKTDAAYCRHSSQVTSPSWFKSQVAAARMKAPLTPSLKPGGVEEHPAAARASVRAASGARLRGVRVCHIVFLILTKAAVTKQTPKELSNAAPAGRG